MAPLNADVSLSFSNSLSFAAPETAIDVVNGMEWVIGDGAILTGPAAVSIGDGSADGFVSVFGAVELSLGTFT